MEKLVLLAVTLTPAIIACYLVGLVMAHAYQRIAKSFAARKKFDVLSASVEPPKPIPDPEQVRYVPAAMAVRDIQDGKGTVIIRYRVRRKLITAHLIVWAGKKRKKCEDSYYDLGVFNAFEVSEEIIAQAVEEANSKMAELARPRKAASAKAETTEQAVNSTVNKQVAVEQSVVDQSATTPTVVADANTVTVDDGDHQPVIRMKKVPTVFRGIIVESGMMKRPLDDKIIDSFGIRYKTPEGFEDAVWGVDLKRAMESARVSVGDYVEILKIGRKTVEKGKAPMNLYQIAKIPAGRGAQ